MSLVEVVLACSLILILLVDVVIRYLQVKYDKKYRTIPTLLICVFAALSIQVVGFVGYFLLVASVIAMVDELGSPRVVIDNGDDTVVQRYNALYSVFDKGIYALFIALEAIAMALACRSVFVWACKFFESAQ